MARRNNKQWAPTWRQEREKGARAVQHNFSHVISEAQRAAESWTVEDALVRVANIKATLEEAEATLLRYKEREPA